jgi:hypothetical protein
VGRDEWSGVALKQVLIAFIDAPEQLSIFGIVVSGSAGSQLATDTRYLLGGDPTMFLLDAHLDVLPFPL